jgi:hypothetical protein
MKKLYFPIFLFLILCGKTQAQYHPLLDNPSWIVGIANFGGGTNVLINPGVDVVINGVTYKKFIDSAWGNSEVFLREDVAEQKVYRRVNNADVLLYDFSLTLGSTITLDNGLGYNVNSVDNIQVGDGTTRKRIHLNNFITSETWIEGVGSPNDPLKPYYELPSDPYLYVQCSFQGSTNIYNLGLVNTGTPTDCASLGLNPMTHRDYAALSPNPFSASAIIKIDHDLQNAKIQIYNQLGQIVKETANINGNEIPVTRDNLKSGIYFLQLLEDGKTLATQKIMIID